MVNKFFDKKTASGGRMTRNTGMNVNEVLFPELLKQVVKYLKRRKAYSRFKDNRQRI